MGPRTLTLAFFMHALRPSTPASSFASNVPKGQKTFWTYDLWVNGKNYGHLLKWKGDPEADAINAATGDEHQRYMDK